MGAVYFYHLTSSPLEVALPELLARSLQAGWRVLVRGTRAEQLDWLDQKLWLGREEDFLPHGLAGGPHDGQQPVLLTSATGNPNGAACLMAVDGAVISPGDATAVERACILFDGNDPASVELARAQWKDLTAAGCAAVYWAQDGGKWVKKAEAGPTG